MCLSIMCRGFNCSAIGTLAHTVSDILCNRARKEEDILFDSGHLGAQGIETPVAHIDTIDQHAPCLHIIDAIHQFCQCALSSASLTDNSDGLSWFGTKGDIF